MRDILSLEVIHSKWAPDRVAADLVPRLEAFANASDQGDVAQILRASELIVDDAEKVLVKAGFGAVLARRSLELAKDPASGAFGNPLSLWSIVSGLTAAARDIEFTDDRVRVERRAAVWMDKQLN